MIPPDAARRKFRELYGAEPDSVAFAPGRVNLIGEHIDYAGGMVLPLAILQGVTVAAKRFTGNREFAAWSDLFADEHPVEFGAFAGQGYFETIVARCADETGVHGAQVVVLSDLAPGRGLSSSAALCVALAGAFAATMDKPPFADGLELARACQRTEIAATGVSCGLMDQYVSVFGLAGHAVRFDTARLSHDWVPLPDGPYRLVVIDSGQPRQLAGSRYNQRREELEMAFTAISERLGPGRLIPDFDADALESAVARLPNPFKRRMHHVLSEHQRVRRFSAAMEQRDLRAMGCLLSESHRSLTDDYEVSTPEIDLLVALLGRAEGVHGARIVGGGFGGAVIAMLSDSGDTDISLQLAEFGEQTDLHPEVIEVSAGDGAQVWAGGRHRLVREYTS